ncbi:MAG: 8-amino-7-oxononanoate synthase [Muribaculaceae bacterium]|nr:8-amino-7-oxononanoate synthase [Muribaculaceae bacterium]
MDVDAQLARLEADGNLRYIPEHNSPAELVDLSSNDYLGLAKDISLREEFLASHPAGNLLMTASASRLLAGHQESFTALERLLSQSYGGRPVLLFNSGYHANTGLVSALASGGKTLVIADKLVHASIIDGIRLSGAPFERFRHNDYNHLERLLQKHAANYSDILLIVESVYSMDGDRADLRRLVELRRDYPNIILYVDEAHAVGACGPAGLGCAAAEGVLDNVDILVGTLGKALASSGAFAVLKSRLREFMINRARSLIFSTALPPAVADWTMLTWRRSLEADSLRHKLHVLATKLAEIIPGDAPSHIRPLIVGDANRAVELSRHLADDGFKVLPIRTPTVPPGTERLRFSLSASIDPGRLDSLATSLKSLS